MSVESPGYSPSRSAAWARETPSFIEQRMRFRAYCGCGWIGEPQPGTGNFIDWQRHAESCDVARECIAYRHHQEIEDAARRITQLEITIAMHRDQLEELGLVDV